MQSHQHVVTSFICMMTSLTYMVKSENYLHVVEDVCQTQSSTNLIAVIIVCSSVDHRQRRDAIRHTWASAADLRHLRVVFMLGRQSDSDVAVSDEARMYNDVIQADFIDSYGNLSMKSITALKWAAEYAKCARFVVKSDDDTFINTPLLSHDLDTTTHRQFVMGYVIARAQPVRIRNAKWFTPISVYHKDVYPTYASGAAYAISGDSVKTLLEAAASTDMFWIEDVYVTGMLAKKAGLKLIVNGKWDGYRRLVDNCAVKAHIIQHRLTVDEFSKLWNIIVDETNCDSV